MKPTDFRTDVVPRIVDLAESFDRKPPGDAALRVWWSVLESLSSHAVCSALTQWARTKAKFPAPAEVYAIAADVDAEKREERLAAERATVERELKGMGATEQGRRALALIRDAIARRAADPVDPRAWAHRILDRYVDGETVPDLSLRYACEAVGQDPESIRTLRRVA